MGMTNCERCCFYEHCTKTGRCENKDCIYGRKVKKEQDGNEKIFFRYGGAILFACFVGIKIGRYAADQEYDFAMTFAVWVICSFVEGWLTHSLQINPELIKLRDDNIELMRDNIELMDMIKEEREKNGNQI